MGRGCKHTFRSHPQTEKNRDRLAGNSISVKQQLRRANRVTSLDRSPQNYHREAFRWCSRARHAELCIHQMVQKGHNRGQTERLHLSSVCQIVVCSILSPNLMFSTNRFMTFILLSDVDPPMPVCKSKCNICEKQKSSKLKVLYNNLKLCNTKSCTARKKVNGIILEQ